MPERNMPPDFRGADRGNPAMSESPGSRDLLSRLASKGQPGGGGNVEAQSAQMLMDGAAMLLQASQMNPALQPIVQRAIDTLRVGVQSLAQGVGGGPPSPPQRRPRSTKGSPRGYSPSIGEEEYM